MRKVGARGTHSAKNGEIWSSHVVASQRTEKRYQDNFTRQVQDLYQFRRFKHKLRKPRALLSTATVYQVHFTALTKISHFLWRETILLGEQSMLWWQLDSYNATSCARSNSCEVPI